MRRWQNSYASGCSKGFWSFHFHKNLLEKGLSQNYELIRKKPLAKTWLKFMETGSRGCKSLPSLKPFVKKKEVLTTEV